MIEFHIQIDEADLARFNAAFDGAPQKARSALANAINKAARHARKDVVNKAKSAYYFKPGIHIGDMKLERASPAKLTAKLEAKGESRTAKEYKTRFTKRDGVKVSVLRASSPRALGEKGRRAFMGPGGNIAGLVAQRKGKSSMPVRVPHGPSIAKMFEMAWKGGGKAGLSEQEPITGQDLQNELEHAMPTVL